MLKSFRRLCDERIYVLNVIQVSPWRELSERLVAELINQTINLFDDNSWQSFKSAEKHNCEAGQQGTIVHLQLTARKVNW